MDKSHRGTIFVEDAEILAHQAFDGDQYVLTLKAPKLAATASPGMFAHIRCDEQLPMRRPLSVMFTDPVQGSAQFLYKSMGKGSAILAAKRPGEFVSVLGPIGQPFSPSAAHPRALLLGGGVGIPPMVFLTAFLRAASARYLPTVMIGSEVPFPFEAQPSQILVPGVPPGVIAAMPLMEDWGVASRLASLQGYAGCHDGYVTDLAREWLTSMASAEELAQVAVYACGPTPMLRACAELTAEFGVPGQVCLEEFMACAVGGCAGCTVRVREGNDYAMRRVCVDGPVFASDSVVWQ